MAGLVVKNDTRLDEFLRSNGVQQWRIPILAANGGLAVVRGKGGQVALKGASTPLKKNDIVTLVSPMPKPCATALQREADTNWRDYAIAPGIQAFDNLLREFLKVRTKTVVIDTIANPSMANLQGFIQGIATSPLITNPIRDLVVAGHASGVAGTFKIALTPGAGDRVEYEDLEAAVMQKTLIVDVSLMEPRPSPASKNPPRMRLFGCAVGRAAPFMRKLKEALGNRIFVTAPNHLLIAATLSPGQLAYMAYAFRVFLPSPPIPSGNKRPARTKKEVVDAGLAATADEAAKVAQQVKTTGKQSGPPGQYQLLNGSFVTKTQWNSWVPSKPDDPRWSPPNLFKKQPAKDPHQITNMVVLPVLKLTRDAPRQFHNQLDHQLFSKAGEIKLNADPGTDADRKKVLKAHLQKSVIYTPQHPFPLYVRFGYSTLDEFVDGCNWQFFYDTKNKTLKYMPIRDEYAAVVPITKYGELMMNFYQKTPPPKRLAKQIPIEKLLIDDRFFFTTY